jgi:hypothetical protein
VDAGVGLRVRLLGSFAVDVDGRAVAVPSGKDGRASTTAAQSSSAPDSVGHRHALVT